MKTLKIVFIMILLSLFMTSCTDLINSDDETILDPIENTTVNSSSSATGGSNGSGNGGGGGGKGGG